MFNTIPVLQSAGKDIGRFYTGLDETPDYLFFTFLLLIPMDTPLPSDQCERKIKLHNLFKEIAELSDFSLIPSLINHFQKESLDFQNQNDFFVDFPSNKEKQKIYFGYRNFIDALMW